MDTIAIFVTILLLGQKVMCEDVFSSMDDMENLHKHESVIEEIIEQHIKQLDTDIRILDRYINMYYPNFNYTEEDAEEYVSNPLNTFAMIKRHAIDWPELKERLFGQPKHDQLQELNDLLSQHKVTETDIEGALNGLLLLIKTYDLNVTEFANGKIRIPHSQAIESGRSSNPYIFDSQLTTRDVHLMGMMAFNAKQLDRSIEILQAAEKLAIERQDKEDLLKNIRSTLKTVIKKHDEHLLKPIKDTGVSTFQKPMNPKLAKHKKFAKKKHLRKKEHIPLFEPLDDIDAFKLFDKACRGEKLRKPEHDKGLVCKLLHYQNPFLKLGPFKLEEKNHAPFVGIFRDFFSATEIESYLNVSHGKTTRSQHSGKMFGESAMLSSWKRTSKQIWLKEFPEVFEYDAVTSPLAGKVTYRIQNATLMNAFSYHGAEVYQVANYGIGGQYSKHWDAGVDLSGFEKEGDRTMTFMGYLGQVEAGGGTAFPYLGLVVWPKQGDAVAWYNLDKNGNLDPLTNHGGCPVIKGSKWITNKWIRMFSQFANYPCALSPTLETSYRRMPPLTNDLCKMTPSCKPRFGRLYPPQVMVEWKNDLSGWK